MYAMGVGVPALLLSPPYLCPVLLCQHRHLPMFGKVHKYSFIFGDSFVQYSNLNYPESVV